MKTNRYAAERGLIAGRNNEHPDANPFRRTDRRDLWERGRVNGKKGGAICGAISPHPPSPCKCGRNHPSEVES